MTPALIKPDRDIAEPRSEVRGDSIDAWLAVLVRLLDISTTRRDAIRDEIEAHLRERVRDLMITGTPEHDAVRAAISELGEVADLARRFSHASKSRTRRTIMNAAVLAFGALSVASATVFLGGPQPAPRVAIFNAQPPAAAAYEATILDDRATEVHFEGMSLDEVLRLLAAQSDLDLLVDARSLEAQGILMEQEVPLGLNHARPVSQVLALVSQQFEHPFAWRVHDQILEIATPETFDRREVVLASFDVQSVLDRICEDTGDADEATARLESLVIDYIEPNAWDSNGGDLASLRIVGGKMFVKAPSRFHPPIEWIIAQLEENAHRQTARSGSRGVISTNPFASAPAVADPSADPLIAQPATPAPRPESAPTTPALPGGGGAATPAIPGASGAPSALPPEPSTGAGIGGGSSSASWAAPSTAGGTSPGSTGSASGNPRR